MKVKELIKLLLNVDPEREVIIASDEEGNNYHIATDILDNMNYDPDEEEIHYEELTEELEKVGYTEEDVRTDGMPAVVIWP